VAILRDAVNRPLLRMRGFPELAGAWRNVIGRGTFLKASALAPI
jgi:hypothetical protein